MDDSIAFALPPSLARRLYALLTALVVIVVGLLVRVIDGPRWAPWWRVVGLVVVVVVVVLVLRAAPPHLVR